MSIRSSMVAYLYLISGAVLNCIRIWKQQARPRPDRFRLPEGLSTDNALDERISQKRWSWR